MKQFMLQQFNFAPLGKITENVFATRRKLAPLFESSRSALLLLSLRSHDQMTFLPLFKQFVIFLQVESKNLS